MIVAGPGSGKTHVVTRRIARLVASGAAPERILAITFTNKAAREMAASTTNLITPSDPTAFDPGSFGDDPWNLRSSGLAGSPIVSTFHSFCARLLRREIYRVEPYSSNFTIYDTTDQKSLIEEAVQSLDLDKKSFPAGSVSHWISRLKNSLRGPEDVAEESSTFKEDAYAKIYARYQKLLEERNSLDFDDLLLVTLRVLTEHPDVLERRQWEHEFLLVDEFQDTNRPQYAIAKLLALRHRNLAITGDPDQSIYSWRGAAPSNFEDFKRDFPEFETVMLNQNYRSTPEIVATASRLTRGAVGQRTLFTENPSGDPVVSEQLLDDRAEARRALAHVEAWRDEGTSLSEIAILYRTNTQSRRLEEELLRRSIPYVVVGGVAFYQRREIKDVLAYLRAAVSPRDEVALRRIVNVPTRGVGPKTLDQLQSAAAGAGLTLMQAIRSDGCLEQVGRARKGLLELRALFEELESVRSMSIAHQIETVVERTHYADYLKKIDPESYRDRLENLEELQNASAEIEQLVGSISANLPEENRIDPLTAFLERVALLSDLDEWQDQDERLTLLTLHSAKGLEFDRVLIVGFEDQLIPHVRHYEEGTEDEERRLLYVGITRARRSCRLLSTCYRRTFRETEPRRPSPFQSELIGEGFEIEEAREPAWSSQDRVFTRGDADFGEDSYHGFADDDFGDCGDEELYPGVWLEHDLFGRGVIESVSGRGAGLRIAVRFEEIGLKKLAVSVSPFRIIGDPTA